MSGIKRAAVVHSHSGFDELTPCGPADVALIEEQQSRLTLLDPRDFGLPVSAESELIFPDRDEALRVMRAVLAGRGPEAVQNMVALNLGLALHLLENDLTIRDGVNLALNAVRRGTAGGRSDA
jgi:anthranilate phosphoribosyltransferase